MAGQPTLLLFLPFLLLFPLAASHNITTMLAKFSDFSTFSDLLTRTQVASDINSRKTITVLAVNNDAMSSASGQPTDALKKILSLHVVLDYYDGDKIHKLPNRSAILTTLFQSSGVASDRSGFLNVTDMDDGQVSLGSAVPGSSLDANFVKVLETQPYNISVLQISSVIVPPGLSDGAAPKASPAPSKSAAPSLAPSGAAASPASNATSPSADSSNATSPSADSPTSGAPATSPAEAMAVDGTPAGAPSDVADGPAGDSSAADGLTVGGGAAAAMGFAMLGCLWMS
ncbi:hypothetical protein OPV22_014570 [Ensete ventricosum]|uniref:FAS1 domain-containing protein n=1 Tax=Ensete ventricosum TaxID=4639 RepID=A0A427AX73_ENSVE|nr:hypothetical protein OPV22_014570 [Ensete ventricosum]RRT80843.1 hypothetical protein B296_00012763 [Ensete ventricosum]RWW84964.1 hypothetical protein BHE74_00006397 [Ensete ventricosum]